MSRPVCASPEPRMDAGEPDGCSRSLSEFQQWIVEHVWAHNMMEVLRAAVDASCWPDVDLQPVLPGEPWRLRVASACVFSIVRSRDLPHFERAMGFLDAAHRLLPGLVAAIKHMKILFGLKTMVIMGMLREGRGTVEIVSKINQFFPNKLPQYQGQCSPREMFLMRKNQQDFKRLAQALALDRNQLQDYIQHQMEQQYGERYAQRVEDRLLQYLRLLQAALPGETHIDKILRKQSPVTEEEKLLLDVVTSDCSTVTTTVRKLLHCDVPSCGAAGDAPPPDGGGAAPSEPRPEGSRGSEDEPSAAGGLRRVDGDGDGDTGQRRRDGARTSSPQFCSKHRRWVRSILQECPDDCRPLGLSPSPPLFPSSSSTSSSSQDLTPSDLVPCPSGGPRPEPRPRDPSSGDDRAAVASRPTLRHDEASPEGRGNQQAASASPPAPRRASGDKESTSVQPDTPSDWESPPQPDGASSSISLRPRIKRTSSTPSSELGHAASSEDASNKPSGQNSPRDQSVFQECCPLSQDLDEPDETEPRPQDSSSRDRRLPARMSPVVLLVDIASHRSFGLIQRTVRPPSDRKRPHEPQAASSGRRRPPAEHSPRDSPSPAGVDVSGSRPAATPPSDGSARRVPPPARSSPRAVHRNAAGRRPKRPASSGGGGGGGGVGGAQLRLSLQSQVSLLRSKLLQPYVSLTRLSARQCRPAEPEDEPEDEPGDDSSGGGGFDSSFDLNELYSDSSGSGGEEAAAAAERDPEYRPCIKKQRLLQEYESARVLHLRPTDRTSP